MFSNFRMILENTQEQSGDNVFNRFFESPSVIRNNFYKIWKLIIKKTGLDLSINKNLIELNNLVVYDILDGSRSTMVTKSLVGNDLECIFYVLNFVHTLKALGAKSCYIMIHTSYNRERGEKEFKRILNMISIGAPFIKKFMIKNNIRCLCIGQENNYENIHLLNDLMDSAKKGVFHTYFLFDYNEKWIINDAAKDIIKKLPYIDVHIRHTKLQVSGGWIPDIMSHSAFLYSQNGTVYSNWKSDELVVLIALALLAKLLHKDEILNKTYQIEREIYHRFVSREIELFNKTIYLQECPKKLFIIGSPNGIYQFYY